jgi:DNA-directed RNA polymerase specialized sigma subunit
MEDFMKRADNFAGGRDSAKSQPYKTPPRYTKEEVDGKIEAFRAEHGRPPCTKEIIAILGLSRAAIHTYKKKYGFELHRKKRIFSFTKEKFAAKIDALAAEHGRPPYNAELAAAFGVLPATMCKYSRKYGLEHRICPLREHFTKEKFAAKIDAFAAEHGRPPYNAELAAAFGIPGNTVSYYKKKYGLKLPRKTISK